MHQENLENEFDRLLAERLRQTPGHDARAALRRAGSAIYRILKGCGREPDAVAARLRDDDLIARIHLLPSSAQEALRRYFVFGEAQASIAFSMNMSPHEFHRLLLDSRKYVLGRQESAALSHRRTAGPS
jgi:hypothetical protein